MFIPEIGGNMSEAFVVREIQKNVVRSGYMNVQLFHQSYLSEVTKKVYENKFIMRKQTAVTAYFKSGQLLPLDIVRQKYPRYMGLCFITVQINLSAARVSCKWIRRVISVTCYFPLNTARI